MSGSAPGRPERPTGGKEAMDQPLVAVSTDVKTFERYTWHATPEPYLEAAISAAGVLPVLVPCFGGRLDLDSLLSSVDGVMLTGAKSNVHPSRYGAEADEKHGPYDERRDDTTLPLIRRAIEKGVPLLAICRGIQELNVALGGTLAGEIQEQEGALDHRSPESENQDERFAIRHGVNIAPGGCLARLFAEREIRVNSVHRQGIAQLAPNLRVEATAPDGTIEAVCVAGAPAFAVGVQWHPEYWAASDAPSRQIFEAFGAAVRAHRSARAGASAAA